MSELLSHIPIVVLCGGQGSRLRPVLKDRPKILAPIGKVTLLDITLSALLQAGFEKIFLSVGYLKEQIERHVKENNYQVIISSESEPLGTGGALAATLSNIGNAEHFFAMNGDMIFDLDFAALHHFHLKKRALMSMALMHPYEGDVGTLVELNAVERITGLRNKKTEEVSNKEMFLNAGVYLFKKEAVGFFPATKCFSLEQDVFPELLKKPCYGFKTRSYCVDIGTPERYARALTERADLW